MDENVISVRRGHPAAMIGNNRRRDVKISDGSQGDGKGLASNATGLASWKSTRTYIALGSDAGIGANTFVGLGSSGASFVRNSIVAPFNGVITSLVFSVRQQSTATITCEIFKAANGLNPVSTGIIATVNIGTTFNMATGNVPVNMGDLISVRISGSLSEGAAATIGLQ